MFGLLPLWRRQVFVASADTTCICAILACWLSLVTFDASRLAGQATRSSLGMRSPERYPLALHRHQSRCGILSVLQRGPDSFRGWEVLIGRNSEAGMAGVKEGATEVQLGAFSHQP